MLQLNKSNFCTLSQAKRGKREEASNFVLRVNFRWLWLAVFLGSKSRGTHDHVLLSPSFGSIKTPQSRIGDGACDTALTSGLQNNPREAMHEYGAMVE
jgi:hypothetical protein